MGAMETLVEKTCLKDTTPEEDKRVEGHIEKIKALPMPMPECGADVPIGEGYFEVNILSRVIGVQRNSYDFLYRDIVVGKYGGIIREVAFKEYTGKQLDEIEL